MEQIEKKPAISGFIGTVLIWILFILIGFIVPAKKQYKTIQIRLDAPAATAKAKAAAAPAKPQTEQSAPAQTSPAKAAETPKTAEKAVEKPAVQKTETKAPQKAAEKTPAKPAAQKTNTAQESAPQKSSSAPAKTTAPAKPAQTTPKTTPVQQTLTKSVEEIMAEQLNAKPKQKKEDFDWSQFDDVEENTSTSTNSAAAVAKIDNALSGSAASASNNAQSSAASTSSSGRVTDTGTSASTANLLGSITSTSYSAKNGNGVSSESKIKTGSTTDGKIAMEMQDGSARVLEDPAEPRIILSEKAAAAIDATKKVQITITVSANGRVSGVLITPSSILPTQAQLEVRQQISSWRFSSASSEGKAIFEYTIIKN